MKILFISSGYKEIYEWFESCIQKELKIIGQDVEFFSIEKGMPDFQSLIAKFNPDMAFTLVGFYLPADMLQYLKQRGIKTAVWLTEDPYYMDLTSSLAEDFDYVFTIDAAALEYYQKKGHQQAYHLPLATDSHLFAPKQVDKKYQSDICLVGYPYPDRIRCIQLLLHYTPFHIQVVGPWKHLLRKFRRYQNISINYNWMDPSIVANYYNGAKIVLNTHRPANERHNENKLGVVGKSINNRTFDVASCAAFQLIEYKEGLSTNFLEEKEIVSFKSEKELIEKANYYIQADEKRREIAKKGRERVEKEHTFFHRVDEMISIILRH
ncbi:CgeB family protein [Niallia nealsonii]|uniref:Protein CgeB n=1 Tax=Niallia nealsonii TaxID=115979 RepID=A0A2N0YZS2_9BACI|nr:glycosyltransferase [Niallia nealsonii]PKG22760.1 protein CgeB [Niallia nealsonii]